MDVGTKRDHLEDERSELCLDEGETLVGHCPSVDTHLVFFVNVCKRGVLRVFWGVR